jgi:predicted O-methyltransferase YrrM|tara:strand:+ start:9209 stop:9694 length:486 start_codon:yes stop_codon:yes gene_type:complete
MARWDTLEKFIKEKDLSKGAELGVWKGKTILHLLKSCPSLNMVGIDAWESQGKWSEWDHNQNEREVRYKTKQFGNRCKLIKGKTWEVADQIEDDSLDFVFIDADHSEDGVTKDIELYKSKVKKGGYVMGHDYDWKSVRAGISKHYDTVETTSNGIWWVQCQ